MKFNNTPITFGFRIDLALGICRIPLSRMDGSAYIHICISPDDPPPRKEDTFDVTDYNLSDHLSIVGEL